MNESASFRIERSQIFDKIFFGYKHFKYHVLKKNNAILDITFKMKNIPKM